MKWKTRILRWIPALALAVAFVACDNAAGRDGLLGPQSGTPSQDLLTTAGELLGTPAVVYKPLKGKPGTFTRVEQKVIGPTESNNVGVAGHVIIVPAGAVLKPTLFRMEHVASSADGTTKVEVFLTAWQQDASGQYTVSVGERGFLLPVQLRMTSSWVTDTFDPSQVRIVWQRTDGAQEVQFTDRSPDGRYRAFLMHFSDYIMAIP